MKSNNTIITMCALAASTLGFSGSALATPITGTISFSGTASMDTANFMTATKFTSFSDVFVGAPSAVSGDYAGTSGAAVTVTAFTFNPANASTPLDPLWVFMSGGKTYSFDLNTLHVDFADPTGLLVSGLGVAHITGEADTAGEWDFSTQTEGVTTFTFSGTTTVPFGVADNANTVMLLGGLMCGCAVVQRKLKINI